MPNRRAFLKSAAGATAALAASRLPLWSAPAKPQVAITLDDPKPLAIYGMSATELNQRILVHLRKAHVKAALFVCGMRVDNADGRALLKAWNDAGHVIGNHSYSHLYLHSSKITLQAFEDDIAKGEAVVHDLPRFQKLFRFPFFKEGNTVEKRDGVRKFLHERGYRIGRATIDASDWAIDGRLVKRLAADPKADLSPYRDFYLAHIWERAQFYDALSVRVLGSRPRHTILLHHSLLNALFLGDLLQMFKHRGWEVIDAAKAYEDPVYARQPNIMPAGESLIWASAKETGRFESELRYPGEDSEYEDPKMDALKL